jgi:Tripartite tricarboxylate transporter family receptor
MSKDFTPITLAATFPTVIMIHPSVPAKNVQEFVALVKSQPGKLADLVAIDGVDLTQQVELLPAMLSEMRVATPGPGNGWRLARSAGTRSSRSSAHLVLGELDQIHAHARRQIADISGTWVSCRAKTSI